MQGASRGALSAARHELEQALATAERSQLSADLFAVSELVTKNSALRRALVDPAREGSERAELMRQLVGSRVSADCLRIAQTAVSQRWASANDLAFAIEHLAVETTLAAAQYEQRLGRVEDELFRLNRIISGSSDLRAAVTERRAPAESKATLVRTLLADKTAPETLTLAERAVAGPRPQRFDHAIESYLQLAAERQEQATAVVTTATPLTDTQQERLAAALSAQSDLPVHTNVIVDPSVIGGVRIELGDTVIDGTVAHRLEEARRHLAG